MFNDSLIMAGGSGTRLWPASSSRFPKQFLPANDKMSFFSLALERALALSQRVIVIAGAAHLNHVIRDTGKFSSAQRKRVIVIAEPAAKNTAPAIACAVVYSMAGVKKPDSRNMIVLTSDHIIQPLDVFIADASGAKEAADNMMLAVFGIKPKRPETGYGYIETGNTALKNKNILNVTSFREKPDLKTAEKYTAEKNFFWNSGMFAFNINFMAQQFSLLAPQVINPFEKLKPPDAHDYTVCKGVKILADWKGLNEAYKKTKSISFDYAIAENCKKIVMIKTKFDWIDIGNWDEYSNLKQSGKININNDPDVFKYASSNCYIDSDIPAALAGVDDLIIVIRSGKNGEPACALITKKGKTQNVKDVVEQIKASNRKDLL